MGTGSPDTPSSQPWMGQGLQSPTATPGTNGRQQHEEEEKGPAGWTQRIWGQGCLNARGHSLSNLQPDPRDRGGS